MSRKHTFCFSTHSHPLQTQEANFGLDTTEKQETHDGPKSSSESTRKFQASHLHTEFQFRRSLRTAQHTRILLQPSHTSASESREEITHASCKWRHARYAGDGIANVESLSALAWSFTWTTPPTWMPSSSCLARDLVQDARRRDLQALCASESRRCRESAVAVHVMRWQSDQPSNCQVTFLDNNHAETSGVPAQHHDARTL